MKNYYFLYQQQMDEEREHEEIIGPFSSKEEAEQWHEKLPLDTVEPRWRPCPSFWLIPPDEATDPAEFLAQELEHAEEWAEEDNRLLPIRGWVEEKAYWKSPEGQKRAEELEVERKKAHAAARKEREEFLKTPEGKKQQAEEKERRQQIQQAQAIRKIG